MLALGTTYLVLLHITDSKGSWWADAGAHFVPMYLATGSSLLQLLACSGSYGKTENERTNAPRKSDGVVVSK